LGVSIPTLKRMAAEGRLESFRTPGGHLRILGESVDAVRDHPQTQPRPVRDASPVLQNRRERLEELTLEAQERRAKRELARFGRRIRKKPRGRKPKRRPASRQQPNAKPSLKSNGNALDAIALRKWNSVWPKNGLQTFIADG